MIDKEEIFEVGPEILRGFGHFTGIAVIFVVGNHLLYGHNLNYLGAITTAILNPLILLIYKIIVNASFRFFIIDLLAAYLLGFLFFTGLIVIHIIGQQSISFSEIVIIVFTICFYIMHAWFKKYNNNHSIQENKSAA